MKTSTRLLVTGALSLALGTAGIGAALADHGAIAYSPKTGSYGFSHSAGSRGQAEQTALRHCRKHAGDCKVVVHVQNSCAALASGKGNGYGWGRSKEREAAQSRAMNECGSRTTSCRIRAWTCSG